MGTEIPNSLEEMYLKLIEALDASREKQISEIITNIRQMLSSLASIEELRSHYAQLVKIYNEHAFPESLPLFYLIQQLATKCEIEIRLQALQVSLTSFNTNRHRQVEDMPGSSTLEEIEVQAELLYRKLLSFSGNIYRHCFNIPTPIYTRNTTSPINRLYILATILNYRNMDTREIKNIPHLLEDYLQVCDELDFPPRL